MLKTIYADTVDSEILSYVIELATKLGLFLIICIFSPFFGRFLPRFLRWILVISQSWLNIDIVKMYDQLIKPFDNFIAIIGTLCLITISLNLLVTDSELNAFLGFFIYSALSISILLFTTKASQKLIRRSLIVLVKRFYGEVNEVVLVFETLIYTIIVILAILIFARGLNLDLVTIVTSIGISGVVFAFASQNTFSNFFGTLELYLDRPFVVGEYIRINFNPYSEDIYGRIESIGLRSTKIRIVAQNTIMIVPNSMMAKKNIENITRGKKIMAMLCLDFMTILRDKDKALVQQVINEATKVFWNLAQTNTRIQFCLAENQTSTRARIIFFFTGTGENSLELRQGLLKLANQTIANKLESYNLFFSTPEPVIYIDSPMSI